MIGSMVHPRLRHAFKTARCESRMAVIVYLMDGYHSLKDVGDSDGQRHPRRQREALVRQHPCYWNRLCPTFTR